MTVVPIEDLGRRMPEAGRIRLGVKGSRGEPRSIQTLRFTSENEGAIREIAALYGGEVKPWNPRGSRSEWEVVTLAKSVPIVLHPNALGGTPVYELWSGGGLVRRCDGVSTTVARRTPDGAEQAEVPCICNERDRMECTVTTRLSVILPEINFSGSWRLETHGWYAAKELPGMVDMVLGLQQSGLSRAVLALERRTEIKDGQTRNFVVPVLRVDHTVNEILEGVTALGAIAPARVTAALPSAPLLDDQVAEAELVDDAELLDEPDVPPAQGAAPYLRIAIKCRELGMNDDDRHAWAFTVTQGRTSSTKDLTAEEADQVLAVLRDIERGRVEYLGIVEGRCRIRRKDPS